MPNSLRKLHEVFEDKEFSLIFEKNVDIPLRASGLPIRCNVYRPVDSGPNKTYPVLVTYGPYGKDIWYGDFHEKSYSEVPKEHKSRYAAWETPEPVFWTKHGYIIVRADERGLGQSPGLLDTMSRGTSECFFEVVEWAAEQPWSSGKVGLLGVSYYAGSQWRVAARRPKGLAAIVPWEGMSDYYRDRCRHGGIFSNNFINFWWNRQVITNQYGRPGRAKSKWGEDTIEGDLSESELAMNRRDQNIDNEANRFRDDDYYASKEFDLGQINVPVLSVANWGGILLHLRGNIQGYQWAGSKNKFLRFIVGRHDLPFYYKEEVDVQKSFLDAFLKGEDKDGWSTGEVPPVSVCLRKGDVGFNNPRAERLFGRREEKEWPIARTKYTKYYLSSSGTLTTDFLPENTTKISYEALGTVEDQHLIQFTTQPFEHETEFTGHIVSRLCVSATSATSPPPENFDLDVFVTLRHISPAGKEVFYTGSSGDNVPVCKGWLRVSLRKTNENHPRHREYLPYREYLSTDVQKVDNDKIYTVDIELWPTNVVVEEGGKLIFEVSSGDTQGSGLFKHTNEKDRPHSIFGGQNSIHFGNGYENYVVMPIIPPE
ncbi:x-pro dipeptidyl-peptidase (s15 family) protein [Colletotrichum asianum]|uniref:X-pro dipeptidyl-peptidase (S15 family) protein n=1 Tax=Colletotrichum asianum TaxID=702518 RepID=A0A8H3ZPJ9_9PEZI|nr:x-pro dipeptidyl-peptidase (s15 family) protein [Colletotrichum asianum]